MGERVRPSLVRYADWPQRLWAAVHERRASPYAWGALDCCLYSADLIEAVTGVDLAAGFRGTYADEAGAQRILEAHGWSDLLDLGDHFLPRRRERPRRGDLILRAGDLGPFLGVAWQGGVIGPSARRPIVWRMRDVIACWSVG